jgi:hypothetical protein
MTQVIVLSEPNTKDKKDKILKCIKLDRFLDSDTHIVIDNSSPANYDYIELICKNYTQFEEDLMFLYNKEERNNGVLYLGKFNDGIVNSSK